MVDLRTVDMTVKIGNVTLKNPIMPASWRSNTGPSMQTRRSSFLPLTSKVRTHT